MPASGHVLLGQAFASTHVTALAALRPEAKAVAIPGSAPSDHGSDLPGPQCCRELSAPMPAEQPVQMLHLNIFLPFLKMSKTYLFCCRTHVLVRQLQILIQSPDNVAHMRCPKGNLKPAFVCKRRIAFFCSPSCKCKFLGEIQQHLVLQETSAIDV